MSTALDYVSVLRGELWQYVSEYDGTEAARTRLWEAIRRAIVTGALADDEDVTIRSTNGGHQ